jgi:hypothetical protein
MTWKRLMARNTGACGGLGIYRGEAEGREFFSILAFLIIILEMNLPKCSFQIWPF